MGHAAAFRSDKLGFLLRSARRADVAELRLGRGRTFLLNDPDDIRHVLVTDHHSFTKNTRLMNPVDPALFGEALVGTSKAQHQPKRRALQPVYQQQHLSGFSDVVESCVDELAESWTRRPDVDLVEETVALAHRVRIRVLLGVSAGAATALRPRSPHASASSPGHSSRRSPSPAGFRRGPGETTDAPNGCSRSFSS